MVPSLCEKRGPDTDDADEENSGVPQLIQAGAIPFRRSNDRWEFLLVTSRKGNWIFPKGICDYEEPPELAARRECEEEAGVRGELLPEPVGSYDNEKWQQPGVVVMFLLRFESEVAWQESAIRRREWVTPDEASRRLEKRPQLRELLEQALERLTNVELAR